MQVANVVVARRLEIDIVDFVADRTITPARHPLLQQRKRHINQHRDDLVTLLGRELIQTGGLRGSTRESVEDVTVTTIVLRRTLFNESNRQLVGNELSSFHYLPDFPRQWRFSVLERAKDVSR